MKFIQNIIWKKGNQISIHDKDLSRGICTLLDPQELDLLDEVIVQSSFSISLKTSLQSYS